DVLRITPASSELLVANPNYIVAEILKRIAEAPLQFRSLVVRLVIRRRHQFTAVLEPPDRIQLVVKVIFRQAGSLPIRGLTSMLCHLPSSARWQKFAFAILDSGFPFRDFVSDDAPCETTGCQTAITAAIERTGISRTHVW